MNLRKLRGLRWVKRFAVHQVNHPQSVAEHSFFVALIAMRIAEFTGADEWSVVRHALLHDAAESITGDLPYLVLQRLRRSTEYRDLAAEAESELWLDATLVEYKEVELADIIELKMYLEEERRSGHPMDVIERETMGRIDGLMTEMGLHTNHRFVKWLAHIIDILRGRPITVELVHADNDL